MPQTTQCKQCGSILNLPEHVKVGKRLKCPRCGHRFSVTEADASSVSTVPSLNDAAPASTMELPRRPPTEFELPSRLGDGDLRETFDLPLVSGREAESGKAVSTPDVGDAAALFKDDDAPKRKTKAADARLKARRCSGCGGFVPQGMSICMSCGLDQETGLRVGWEDDLSPPPPPRPAGPPIHVAAVGGLCAVIGLLMLLTGVTQSVRGESDWRQYAWLALALVSAFGVYTSIEFIRGKSARLLLIALTLGIVVDLFGLVVLPIVSAFINQDATPDIQPSDPSLVGVAITPTEFLLDTKRIITGFSVVVLFAILVVYLMSPPVKRYIHSRAASRAYD